MLYNGSSACKFRAVFVITAVCCVLSAVLAASLEYTNALSTVTSGNTVGLALHTALFALIGAAAAFGASKLDLSLLEKYALPIGLLGLLLTGLTFTPLGISPEGSDDRAWLSLGFFTMQPSELLKLCFIITLSAHIAGTKNINSPKSLGLLLLHSAVPTVLVWAQGDQGTALVFGVIAAGMLVSAGLSYKVIAAVMIALPLGARLASQLLLEHQKRRIAVLLDPSLDPLGTGFQQLQSRRAIAGGGLLGKGLFSDGKGFVYVSQSQNDFILAYAAQAAGVIACGVIILLLFRLCIAVTAVYSPSKFGQGIIAGTGALLFSHTLINTASALGSMPVIGVPLPFFSSGGTAMITMLTALGLVRAAAEHKTDQNQNIQKEHSHEHSHPTGNIRTRSC